jgi:hypothetical protein
VVSVYTGEWGWVEIRGAYPTDAFLGAVVAVYEGCVGRPGLGGLVLELFATVIGADALLDFAVDGFLHACFDMF